MRTKCSMMEVVHVISLPPDSWRVPSEKDATSLLKFLALMLSHWVLSGYSQIDFGEWKSMLEPLQSFQPYPMATLFIIPFEKKWTEKKVGWPLKNASSCLRDYLAPYVWSCYLVSIYMANHTVSCSP